MKILKTLFFVTIALLAVTMASCKKETSTDKKVPTENAACKIDKVIDFNATWCGPCKAFAPIFEAVGEEYAGKIKFESVDVDENPELAQKYDVQSIPMVVLLDKDGNVIDSYIGFMDETQFKQLLTKNM